MSRWFTYDPMDGTPLGIFEGPEYAVALQEVGYFPCPVGCDDDTHYVDITSDPPKLVRRLPLEHTVQIEGLVAKVHGLPAGLGIYCSGMEGITDGQALTIEFDSPGVHEIYIQGGCRYLDTQIEVSLR